MWPLLLCGIFLIVFYFYLRAKQYPSKFPPGPRHFLPIFGDPLFAVGPDSNEGIKELHKKYGPILGLNFLGTKFVSFSELDTLQKILATDEFSCRLKLEGFGHLRQGLVEENSLPGLVNSTGKAWKDNRRFTLQTLRDFGFGKQSMEEMIYDEFQSFAKTLEESKGHPIETLNLFNLPILNGLWRILTGERFDLGNPKIVETMNNIETFIADCGNPISFIAFKSTKLLKIIEGLGMISLSKAMNSVFNIVDEQIADHEATFQEDNLRDFIDVFIQKKILTASTEDSNKFAKQNLRNIFLDLFLAGSETTSSTLKWAVLFMAKYPEIQSKVQAEIDNVMENLDAKFACSLRSKMPYTEAVLLETQRRGNVVPLALVHSTSKSVQVGPYVLPPDTAIVPNLTCVHHNPEVFPDPLRFNPDRYIDSQGNFVPHPHVVPFGVGKHRCLGENLAKTELFLFFVGMMQKFSIKPTDENVSLSEAYRPGITICPYPFQARFISRN